MTKVLVTYVSKSGSTAEIARYITKQLRGNSDLNVEVKSIHDIVDLEQYNSIIVGGFLYRFGWHPQVQEFVLRNIEILKKRNTAFFVVGLGLIKPTKYTPPFYPMVLDPNFVRAPENPDKLSKLEQQMTLQNIMKDTLPLFDQIQPKSVGFFAGRLNFQKLNLIEKVIMHVLSLLTGVKAGDYRNWECIKNWAAELLSLI